MNRNAGAIPPQAFRATSRYDDVWSREDEICAFCAAVLTPETQRCLTCGRRLVHSHYLYARESTHGVTLWVLTASSGFLNLTLLLADLFQGNPLPIIILHAFMGLLFLGLSAGLYLRQFWAWAASIPLLMVALFLGLLRVIGIDLAVVLPARLEQLSQPVINSAIMQTLIGAVYLLLLIAQAGALIWAIIFAGPDYSRRQGRIVARLERGMANATDHYVAGRRYAKDDMWATAVLHWQRAAAHAPTHWRYLLALAEGYAQLGFFERSLDVLQSAAAAATGEAAEDVERLRRDVVERQRGNDRP